MAPDIEGRVSFQLRVPSSLYNEFRKYADEAETSINQAILRLMRGAVEVKGAKK